MIHPIPNAAADGGVTFLDNIPILRQVADSITHGVGILADEHRLIKVARILVHPSHTWVHLRIEIRETRATIRLASACSLVMDGTTVKLANFLVAFFEVCPVSGLITETPENYRRMVAIATNHAFVTVHKGGNPTGTVGNALVGVVFQVCFFHDIHTVVVAQEREARRVGIMACAERIDIVLLHQ